MAKPSKQKKRKKRNWNGTVKVWAEQASAIFSKSLFLMFH